MANLSEHNKGSLTQRGASAFALSAYEYLDNIPLIGWAWEFWRRGPLSRLEQNRTFAADEGDFPALPYEPEVFPDLTVKQPHKAMTWEEVAAQRCDPRHLLWTPLVVMLGEEGNEFGLDELPAPRIELSVCLNGSTRHIVDQVEKRVERVKARLRPEKKKAVISEPKDTWKTGLILWDLRECLGNSKDAGEEYLHAVHGPNPPVKANDIEPQVFALQQRRIVRPFIDHHEWHRFACFK